MCFGFLVYILAFVSFVIVYEILFLRLICSYLCVNQLLEPHLPLESGKIRDSNRAMLSALMKEHGYKPVDLGIASDR
jgi:hypothetical protein